MRVHLKNSRSGQTALLLMAMMAIATLGVISAYLPATQFGYKNFTKTKTGQYETFAASMAAQSAIPAMAAALERRWWTPPLDQNCNALEMFTLDIDMSGGIHTNVTGFYDARQQLYTLVSRAWFPEDTQARVAYMQVYKIINAATMMFVSTSPQPVNLYSGNNYGSVGAMIAGSRRLYFSGPLNLCSRTDFSTPNNIRSAKFNWVPGQPNFTQNFATILQADRIYAMGGLGYIHRGSSEPNPNGTSPADPFYTITDYWRQNYSNYLGESCGGGVVITSNYEFANKTRTMVETGSLPPDFSFSTAQGKANLYKQVYPKALFEKPSSTLPGPMKADEGIDNGRFMGNPENWLAFSMSYGGANAFGNNLDLTCLQSAGSTSTDPRKSCSRNTDWPTGFAAWKTQANLNGVLLSNTDNESIRFPKLTWDNLDALREDAEQCGVVVTASNNDGQFEDCNIATKQLWQNYRQNPTQNPCTTVRRVSLDNLVGNSGPGLHLNNYTASDYTDPAKEQKIVRRVIYSTEDIEITQNHIDGLIPTVTNADHRRKLMLWVVNEKTTKLRTYQKMTLANGQPDPGAIVDNSFKRSVYFNQSPNDVQPLPIVMLSPDPVEILSPQFVPVTYANLLADFPVTAENFVKPKVHLATYSRVHENDGFKWGSRNINISNIAFLTGVGSAPNYNDPNQQLFARGLWGTTNDPNGVIQISHACMMDLAGDPWARRAGDSDFIENPLPAPQNIAANLNPDPNLYSVGAAPPTAAEISFGTSASPSLLAERGSAFWQNGQAPECRDVGVAAGSTQYNREGCIARATGLQENREAEDGINLPPRGSYFYTNWSSPECKNYELPADSSDHAGALPGSTPNNRRGCQTQAGFPAVFSLQWATGASQINLKGLRMFLTFEDCQQGAANCNRPSGKRRLDQPMWTYSDGIKFRNSATSQDGDTAPFDVSDRRFIWPYTFYWSTQGAAGNPNLDHPRARCMNSQLGLLANPEQVGNVIYTYINRNADSIVQIVPGDDLNNLGAIGSQPTQALQTVNGLPVGPLVDAQSSGAAPRSSFEKLIRYIKGTGVQNVDDSGINGTKPVGSGTIYTDPSP